MLAAAAPGAALSQQLPGARILVRQARVVRNEAGRLRVIEALRVALVDPGQPDSAPPPPVPLIELQPGAREVRGVGGDLPPTQLVVEPPLVKVIGPFTGRSFEVILTYLLPADASIVEFAARLPQDTLLVEIDQATVDARPDRALRSIDRGGSDARPLLRYQALSLAPGSRFRVEVANRRLDWRERVAVLSAIGLACLAAGVALWRRGGASSSPVTTGDGRTDARY